MRRLLIFVIIFMVFGSSCEKFTEKKYVVRLDNKTNTRLYTAVGTLGVGTAGIYPDTALPVEKPIFSTIAPNSIGYVIYSSAKMETIFAELPKDTLSVYVFQADSVDVLGWNGIRLNNRVLKRYDLSLQDFQGRSFIVTYP